MKHLRNLMPTSLRLSRWTAGRLAGTLLVHFAEDVANGLKKWEEDLTWIVPGKQLAIRYPRAIQGYGAEPPAFSNACADANWLEQDRRNPMKRIFDTPIGDGKHRCILLDGKVCEMLDVLMKQPPSTMKKIPSKKEQQPDVSKPLGMNKKLAKDKSGTSKPAPISSQTNQTKTPSQAPLTKHPNHWPDMLKRLKAGEKGTPVLEKIEGKTLVQEQEAMIWYSEKCNITKSKLRIQLMRFPEKTRFIRVNNKGYIHVE